MGTVGCDADYRVGDLFRERRIESASDVDCHQFLAFLGGLAARAGGAGVAMGAIRVMFWGALALAMIAGVGWLFGTVA